MKKLEGTIYEFLKERNWHNLRPADLAKSIMIEGAELLEHFQWENLSLEEVKSDPEKLAEIRKELADVLIYSLQMSVLLGLDTEEIIREKLVLAAEKYPADLVKNRAGEPGTEKLYREIKQKHRRRT